MLKLSEIFEQILLTEAVDGNKLIKAIKEKRLISIYYDSPHDGDKADYPKGWRRVEPFCYGINNSDNAVLRAWELHGVSYSYPSGKPNDPLTNIPGWRMFRIDGIQSMNEVGNDKFTEARPKYNPNDKDMKIIYAAADFSGKQEPIDPVEPTEPTSTPPETSTFSKEVPDVDNNTNSNSGKPSWFTKFGDKFKNIVNFGKKDSDKI